MKRRHLYWEINMDTHYKLYLYKPSGLDTDFLGELLVDNLNAQIKLHDISTISFTIPETINGVANPRLDQVLDSYIVELRYGKNITVSANYPADYSKMRFTIYSTPLEYADFKRSYSYNGYSIESLLEFKHITNWGGIEVKDFFRTITYNNNSGGTGLFLETGITPYTISTSTNSSSTKYITISPTTAIATPLDIYIYEVRKNTSPASENQAAYVRYTGSSVNDNNFRSGYYFLTLDEDGYVTEIKIALPGNYDLFNNSVTKSIFFKLYDNPLSRHFAIGVNRNEASPFTNMYIDLAHDADLGDDTPEYGGYTFNSQSIYSKNGLKIEQVLLGITNTRDGSYNLINNTPTIDGLLYNTGFTVGYIDPVIAGDGSEIPPMYRSNLEFNNITRYQAIKDLAESFDAIVVYDTIAKTVSFYPQDNTLTTAWENNGLIIKYGTYLKSITKEIDASKIITSSKALGKNNLTISLITPDGSDSWEDFSYYLDNYYVEYDRDNLLAMTYDADTGVAFTSFPVGSSSRWMESAEALKIAQWQYARDYFHDILLGNLNPSITQHDDYFDLYNQRSEKINEFVSAESEFIAWKAQQYKYKYLYDYYYNLKQNGDTTTEVAERLAYYLDEWTKAEAAIATEEAVIEALRVNLFDEENGVLAGKLSEVRAFLDKYDTAKWNINEEKIQSFIRQSVMSDNKLDNDFDLLKATITHVNENKVPKVTLKINIVDILAAQEAYEDWDKLKAGDLINIYFDDFNIDLVAQIKEISIDFEQHTLDVTISTVHNYNMGYGKYVSRTLRRLYNADTNITKHLEDANRISSEESRETYQQLTDGTIKADNAQITFGATDTTGTQSTSFSSTGGTSLVIDVVDPVVETIVFSNNKGVSIGDGVIRTYYNRGAGSVTTEVEISGANGFVIRNINNDTNAITKVAYIDETTGAALFAGWNLDPGQFSSGSSASFVGINSETPDTGNSLYAFWAGNGTASNAPFSVTKAGDIKATSGTIAGLNVGTGYVSTADKSATTNPKNAIFKRGAGGAGVWGENETAFYLDEDGRFSLSNELTWNPSTNTFFVNGTIEATIGEIGGWTVAAEKLHAGSNTTYVELNADAASSYAIFAGDPTAASAPFSVTKSGALVATNATITGAITATSGSFTGSITSETGNIGGWAIGENSLSSGDITLSSVEDAAQISIGENIVLNNDGSATIGVLEIGLDGSVSTETFEIDDEGNATFSGALQAATGSFGAVTIDNAGSLTLSNITIDNSGINATVTEGDPATQVVKFNLDSTTGAITSTSGTIGGWEIGANTLTGGNIILDSTTDEEKISIGTNIELNTDGSAVLGSIEIGSDGSISSTDGSFVIDEDGAAAFAGTLTAPSGSFGAVTIDAAGSITIGNITIDNTDGIVAKDEADDIKFSLNPTTGLLTATDADITGSITAEEGTIAGWEIAETTLSKNNVSLDSAGTITVGDGDDVAVISAVDPSEQNNRIWVGDSDSELAPFKVDMEGNLTSTAGLIGGWTITEDSLSKTFDTESTNPVNIYAGTMPEAITVLSGGTYGFAIENTNPNDEQPFVTAMTNNGFYIFSKASYEDETAIPVMEIQYDDALIWANGLVISDDKNILNSNVVIGKLDQTDQVVGNGYGMVINNGTLETGSKITIDYDGIEIVKRVEGQLPLTTFSVDTSGNVSVKGDLTASTGTFGTVATDKGNVLLGGSDPLIVRNNETNILRLTNAGVLTVAGFTASSSAFYSGDKSTLASNEAGVYIATDGIALGTNSPFKVTSAGALTATSATIGGWTVDSDSIFTGTKTATENYASTAGHITIGSDGHISSKEFRIDADGSAHFGGALDAGVIDDIADSLDLENLISDLQGQIDGAIDTWFYNGEPTLLNLPASEWTTNADKNQHLGDIYYDNENGYAYRFTLDGSTYQWQIISDSAVVAALSTAESKVTIFSVASDANYGANVDDKIQNGDYIIPLVTTTLTAAGRTSLATNYAVTKNDLYLYDSTAKTFTKSQNVENKDTGSVAGWEINSTDIKAKNNTMSLHSDSDNNGVAPYISIAQSSIGYENEGIFLGRVLHSEDPDVYYPKLSLVNSDATNYLKWTGLELQVKGNVDATSGTIGGFTIANDRIKAGTLTGVNVGIGPNMATGVSFYAGAAITSPATEPTNDQINAAPFRVTNTGALNATSATITGTITATDGRIGSTADGWDINANVLESKNDYIKLDAANNKILVGNITLQGALAEGDSYIGLGKTGYTLSETAGIYAGLDNGVAKLSIGNTTNSLTWDGEDLSVTGQITATSGAIAGFTIEDTVLTAGSLSAGASGSNVGLTPDSGDSNISIWAGASIASGTVPTDAEVAAAPFRVTNAGALTSTSGSIGGWTINSDGIFTGTFDESGYTTSGITISNEGSIHSPNFYLDSTGITTKAGNIGGFTIGATSLTAGATTTSVGVTTDAVAFYAGNATPGSAPFRVGNDGALVASSADITGVIKASSGQIGSNAINKWIIGTDNTSASIYNGKTTLADSTNAGIYIGTDGISLGTAGVAPQFSVTSAGVLNASSATITGTITATDGRIGSTTDGWDINANVLESKNDYIKLDAANNRINVGNITLQGDATGSNSYIGLNKTSYALSSTSGIYLGLDNSVAKFSIGANTGNSLTWDGSSLGIVGDIGGTIGNITVGQIVISSTGINTTTDKFSVDSGSGVLTAVDGNFSGTITSTAGNIGGFNIGQSALTAGTSSSPGNYLGMSPGAGTTPIISFWAGATGNTAANISAAKFRVDNQGNVTADTANFGTYTFISGSGDYTYRRDELGAGANPNYETTVRFGRFGLSYDYAPTSGSGASVEIGKIGGAITDPQGSLGLLISDSLAELKMKSGNIRFKSNSVFIERDLLFPEASGTLGVFQSSSTANRNIQFRVGRISSFSPVVPTDGRRTITYTPAFPTGLTYGVIITPVGTTNMGLSGSVYDFGVESPTNANFVFVNDGQAASVVNGVSYIAFAY
jgi:hypothetical protein